MSAYVHNIKAQPASVASCISVAAYAYAYRLVQVLVLALVRARLLAGQML